MTGEQLKDIGIKQAEQTANKQHNQWSFNAYKFLLEYIKTNKEFMTEDLRKASVEVVPIPISLRAWGSVIRLANNNKIIEHIGYKKVKNPKAHCATASFWGVL